MTPTKFFCLRSPPMPVLLMTNTENMSLFINNVERIHNLITGEGVAAALTTDNGFGESGRFVNRGPTAPSRSSFTITVLPHSYVAFAAK
jgi:hypothetical protein